jgi:hypothetical protein
MERIKPKRFSFSNPIRFKLDKRYSLKVGPVGEIGKSWPWETERLGCDAPFLNGRWSGTVFVISWKNAMTCGLIPINGTYLRGGKG